MAQHMRLDQFLEWMAFMRLEYGPPRGATAGRNAPSRPEPPQAQLSPKEMYRRLKMGLQLGGFLKPGSEEERKDG